METRGRSISFKWGTPPTARGIGHRAESRAQCMPGWLVVSAKMCKTSIQNNDISLIHVNHTNPNLDKSSSHGTILRSGGVVEIWDATEILL
jgi:hypothetical protein